jgi:hypothetical protein
MDRAFIDQGHQIGDRDKKATVKLEHIKNNSVGIGASGMLAGLRREECAVLPIAWAV